MDRSSLRTQSSRTSTRATPWRSSHSAEDGPSGDPWQEKTHIRVNWSRNLNTDRLATFTGASLAGIGVGVSIEPLTFDYLSNPFDADSPRISSSEGYVGATNKVFVTPQLIELVDGTSFMWTWLLGAETSPNPAELWVRSSFLRLSPSSYEPRQWDDARAENVGVGVVHVDDQQLRTRADSSKPIVWHYTFESRHCSGPKRRSRQCVHRAWRSRGRPLRDLFAANHRSRHGRAPHNGPDVGSE